MFYDFQSDSQLESEFKNFQELAFGYVSKLLEVNETKKFEFVEIVSVFKFNIGDFIVRLHIYLILLTVIKKLMRTSKGGKDWLVSEARNAQPRPKK